MKFKSSTNYDIYLQIVLVSILGSLMTSSLAEVGSLKNSKKQVIRVPKQIQTKPAVVNTEQDHQTDETIGHLFGGGGAASAASIGHGKYFQYQHQPQKDHYEFGHKRGNEHHFTERHEKAAPHHGVFKTKARWGDKHGGYGEHYWDYNHAGHDHGGGGGGGGGGSNDEESHDEDEGEGGYSHHVPDYLTPSKSTQLTSSSSSGSSLPVVNPYGVSEERVKRQPVKNFNNAKLSYFGEQEPVSLTYDVDTGTVVNEATGQAYVLQPVN